MHFELTLYETIFNLFLFSLLSYKLYEYFQAYAVPLLNSAIQEEKKNQATIVEKEKLLVSTHHRIENQIRQQKKTFFLLEKNVQKWHSFLQEQKGLLERELLAGQRHVQKKRMVQHSALVNALLTKQALPQAFENACSTLASQQNVATNNTLLQSVIKDMDKS